MPFFSLYNGYDEEFLSEAKVCLPQLNQEQASDLVYDLSGSSVIKYINFSLQMSAAYKFPYYTACNIDGLLFKKVPRRDNWRKDDRIASESQLGKEFYSLSETNFDRGHMTKREDVQWGETVGIAMNAADSTFYYTNAVPQHRDLNRDIWRSLEDYILNTEVKKKELKISVFTGPVLSNSNAHFISPVDAKQIKIPFLFWKVVFYKKNEILHRVGFMMSQNKLLENESLIEQLELYDDKLFLEFNDAETYQVNISLIEELTGIALPKAVDSYTDSRNINLVLKEIDINPDLESDSKEFELGFRIENICL
jgi:endonuclease G, mitochondrial